VRERRQREKEREREKKERELKRKDHFRGFITSNSGNTYQNLPWTSET